MASPYMQVTYVDNRVVVVRIGPKSQVHFERQFQKTIFDYARKRSMEEVCWLAWYALCEAGEETRDFEQFLDVVEDVAAKIDTPDNPVGDRAVNPEPDPSRKAQPAAT